MRNSNLITILKKLDAREFRELGEFINSAFFNKNQSVIKLYSYVRKYYPEFEDANLEKENVYKNAFSGAEYNDGFMRTAIFNLSGLVEEYLSYISFKKNPVSSDVYLLDELNNRKLEKQFHKKLSDIQKNIDKARISDAQYFYYKYRVENILTDYHNWRRYKIKDYKDFENKSILNLIEYLTSCFLSGTISYYKFLEHKSHYNNVNIDLKFLDSIIEYIKEKDDHFKDIPKIKVEFYQLLLLKEENAKYYELLKDIYINNTYDLNPDSIYSLGTILQHFCSRMQYKGETKYIIERFKLYKIMIEKKLYANDSDVYFDGIMFASIVGVAFNLQEYNWADKFINDHKELLDPENRYNIVNYSLARIYTGRGMFKEALKCLMEIKSVKHIQLKMPIRTLILISYYELSMYFQAYAMLDSQRHFLNNGLKDLPAERLVLQSNFYKIYAKFLKVKEKMSLREIPELQREINKTPNLPERSWFLRKLEEFEKMQKQRYD
jgi:hypothetical protein